MSVISRHRNEQDRHEPDQYQPDQHEQDLREQDLREQGRHDDEARRREPVFARPLPSSDRHRLEEVRDAGLPRLSWISVLAGVVTAYGTFAVVAAVVGALLANADVQTEFRTNDWTSSGAVAGLVTAAVLLVSYVFGGYVTGRMSRRSGLAHGVAVFALSLVLAVGAGAFVRGMTDRQAIDDNLRSIGAPTDIDQVTGPAVAGVAASLVAMLAGSLIGAKAGERWHGRLVRRAADPRVGRRRPDDRTIDLREHRLVTGEDDHRLPPRDEDVDRLPPRDEDVDRPRVSGSEASTARFDERYGADRSERVLGDEAEVRH